MREKREGSGPIVARLAAAALLAISLSVGSVAISAPRPTKQDLEQAKADLISLNGRLSALVEQYDAAKLELHRLQGRLDGARDEVAEATALEQEARQYLEARAAQAYMGAGSELDVLLGAASYSDFTERLQFLGDVAQADLDAANQAQVAGQQASRAQAGFEVLLRKQRDLLQTLDQRTADIEQGIVDQERLITMLEAELSKPEVEKVVNQPAPPQGDPSPKPPPTPEPPPPPPPPPSSGAQAAVDAAYSVIGVPYKWGGDDPQEGFDCSGMTMWSWAQAGVSLPHSSAAQYAATPRVSKDSLQPGDLLFFYSPISHVGMYVGNNQMIHATHPGSVVQLVTLESYWWAVYVGAGRPG
jgi:peptidoglycan DL-endopeptidase CwlO